MTTEKNEFTNFMTNNKKFQKKYAEQIDMNVAPQKKYSEQIGINFAEPQIYAGVNDLSKEKTSPNAKKVLLCENSPSISSIVHNNKFENAINNESSILQIRMDKFNHNSCLKESESTPSEDKFHKKYDQKQDYSCIQEENSIYQTKSLITEPKNVLDSSNLSIGPQNNGLGSQKNINKPESNLNFSVVSDVENVSKNLLHRKMKKNSYSMNTDQSFTILQKNPEHRDVVKKDEKNHDISSGNSTRISHSNQPFKS